MISENPKGDPPPYWYVTPCINDLNFIILNIRNVSQVELNSMAGFFPPYVYLRRWKNAQENFSGR